MRPSRLLPLLVSATLLAAGTALAQEETGALIVSVTAGDGGAPLVGAQVSVVGTGITVATNAAGVVRLAGVPLGLQTVEVRRLGYAPRLRLVTLEAGRAATASFAMEVEAIPLAAIRVRAQPEAEWDHLERTGFRRRMAMGNGYFVTRGDIEKLHPRFLSDVLRRYPGIVVQPYSTRPGGHVTFARNGPHHCPIQYYVDGMLIGPGFNVDDVTAGDVEGVEIYRGTSQVPPEFNRRTAMCGVIAIWTRMR